MPFSKLIKIGYFVIIPWLFNKTEQLDQDVAEAKEAALQAREAAFQAKEIAEANVPVPMTEQEVKEMATRIFGTVPKNGDR